MGVEMSRSAKNLLMVSLSVVALAAVPAGAQSFGAAKEKVTLQRKLPALVRLPGNSIKIAVTASEEDGALPYDFQALLETELLKDDPDLREDDNPNTTITCRITQYAPPHQDITLGPAVALTKNAPKVQQFERIAGSLTVAFQARTHDGETLVSDNVISKYDEQFDSSGISTTHGVMGSLSGTWGRLKGQKTDDNTVPTLAEVRSRLILDAVQQIAEHIVNTDESVDVFLAKKDGPLDEGDKDAATGLWERALETFETAPPFPKPTEDAYRLYNIGVAYEALAYQAEDEKAAMKYLDQAAINYGKAIDAKPDEKYFIEPQKRIETAIAHYRQLEREHEEAARAKAAEQAAQNNPPPGPAPSGKGLTNQQVIAMVKAGMEETTIIQAIRGADAINFDLTPAGQKTLASGGVGEHILLEMKRQAAKKPAAVVHKGLTNSQVIAMVKAGMDEATIIQTIHGAEEVDFDLSPPGEKTLTTGGVSAHILAAMKARALKRPIAVTRHVAER
jgi:tetratricopeptide (TPR) repeat protein